MGIGRVMEGGDLSDLLLWAGWMEVYIYQRQVWTDYLATGSGGTMLEWRQTGGARELLRVGPGSLPREDVCSHAAYLRLCFPKWLAQPGPRLADTTWPSASTSRTLCRMQPSLSILQGRPHRWAAHRVCAHQIPGSGRVVGDTATPIPSRVSPEVVCHRGLPSHRGRLR